MKKAILFLSVICSLIIVGACTREDITGKNLRILCEDFRPYNYMENGSLKGLSVEIVSNIKSLMSLNEANIELMDWTAAYDLLKTEDNVALFTTVLTSNRKDDFQWVGPIGNFDDGFISLKDSHLEISSINEAKDLPSVGVITGYSTAETLMDKNFDNLHSFETLSEAVNALYDGTISAIYDTFHAILAVAAADGHDGTQLTEAFKFSSSLGYIAFSKNASPKLVETWQEKLDQLKKEGVVQSIYDKYIPGVIAPGLVSIYTEENPPMNFRNSTGELTGSSVEMVDALMGLINRTEPLIMTTWNDGYDNALLNPNSMIFSTVRNSARESLFHWIGPVCKKNYCFFVLDENSIHITSINEAKALESIGVPSGWAAEQELTDLGFTNLQTWSTPEKVFQKLLTGKVQAVLLNDISIKYLAEQAGIPPARIRNELLLSSSENYLAFSLDTKAEYIQEWENAYNTIMTNGVFAGIWAKWYPGIDW